MTALVTTTYRPNQVVISYAQEVASRIRGRFVHRNKYSIPALRLKYQSNDIIVVSSKELKWYRGELSPYFFHPSMAYLRIDRLMKGESDALVKYARLSPGDTVLDCTAGLGSDAIVMAYAVGSTGSVTAVESEAPLALLLEEGLKYYDSDSEELNESMRRIRIVHRHHLDVLRDCPDDSYDVVYFDPMFRQPAYQSPSIEPIRSLSNAEPLDVQSIEQAIRVAKKTVVLKELRDSAEFERLGFRNIFKTYSKIAYGVIEV